MLLALLPKAKFAARDAHVNRALRDQVFHECLSIILEPLKKIAREGCFMSDPSGSVRFCFTTLSMYMVDLPEATRLAGVTSNCSPVSVATSNEFGSAEPADRRWLSVTKEKIEEVRRAFPPSVNFYTFVKNCRKNNLTGVTKLFWEDWPHAEPPIALSYDLLHSGHRFFYDHIVDWSITALGKEEIDARYKLLHPRKGWKHFPKGVSKLTKVTGRDHRNLQRYLLCAIDGFTPPTYTKLVRLFIECLYISQKLEITKNDLKTIKRLLTEFHKIKEIAHEKKYRTSKDKNKPPNWRIPKLEMQFAILFTIAYLGNLLGLSTDITEHEHILMVKEPFRHTNHKNFFLQMVKYLLRMERLRHFDLATAILSATSSNLSDLSLDPSQFYGEDADEQEQFLESLNTVQALRSAKRAEFTNYFALLDALKTSGKSTAEARTRTFIGASGEFTVIHLNRDPSLSTISIDEASELFELPDLSEAIYAYYINQILATNTTTEDDTNTTNGPIIRHSPLTRAQLNARLGISRMKVWFSIKVQTKSLVQPGRINKPATICAEPSNAPTHRAFDPGAINVDWIAGRYDFALFMNDAEKAFEGHANLRGKSTPT